MPRLLITGASGFIGNALAQHLSEQGFEVRGTAFSRKVDEAYPAIDWRFVGSIGPDTEWKEALRDIEVVVHTAGIAHRRGGVTMHEYESVNTAGTLRLAEKAMEHGVRRFIHLSSIAVSVGATHNSAVSETTEVNPQGGYAISKNLSEIALRKTCSSSKLEFVILRPPLVYGPNAPGNFERLIRLVEKGIPLPFASVRNSRSMISISNLVGALSACVLDPRAAHQTYVVSDDADVSTPDLIKYIANGLQRQPALFPMPVGVLFALGKMTGRSRELQSLCGSLQVDCSKIKTQLGWSPQVAPDSAISAAARATRTDRGKLMP